jgi:hypothetical protein
VFAVKAPVLRLPLVDKEPVQPPEAVQDVAFVELQVNEEAPSVLTVVCDAPIAVVGAGVGAVGLLPPQATSSINAQTVLPRVKKCITRPVERRKRRSLSADNFGSMRFVAIPQWSRSS